MRNELIINEHLKKLFLSLKTPYFSGCKVPENKVLKFRGGEGRKQAPIHMVQTLNFLFFFFLKFFSLIFQFSFFMKSRLCIFDSLFIVFFIVSLLFLCCFVYIMMRCYVVTICLRWFLSPLSGFYVLCG